jgi:hypothetical protein
MTTAIEWKPSQLEAIRNEWSELGPTKLAKKLKVSLATLYRKKSELDAAATPASEPRSEPAGGSLALTTIAPTEPAPVELVAMRREDMQAAQSSLARWFLAKLDAVRLEAHDAFRNLETAKQCQFVAESFNRSVRAADRRVQFYEKCLAAVEAGFSIVPNFPVDVIAIRVTREAPKWRIERSPNNEQAIDSEKCVLAPVGAGHYVNPQPTQRTHRIDDVTGHDGTKIPSFQHTAVGYCDVEFPVQIAQPAVMEATRAAMMLNIFDEIGVLPARRKPDPIVVGRIYRPTDKWRDSPVCFLIAWWINTATL